MSRRTATTARALPRAERAAHLEKLVDEGKLTRRQAGLIDLRELTPRERAVAETLRSRAERALARRRAKVA